MIYTPARRLVGVHNSLQQVKAPLERIDRIFEESREKEGKEELKGISEEIVFSNVSFRYENTKEDALENINVRVKKERS